MFIASRLYAIGKAAWKAACVAFAGAIPAASIIADAKGAKLAVVGAVAAGIAAAAAAAYMSLAPLWGKVGNLLRRWKARL